MRSKLTVKAAEALLSLPHYTCGHTVKMEVLLHSGRATLYGVIFRTINSRGNCSHSNVCFSRRMRSRPHVSPSVSLMVVIFFFFFVNTGEDSKTLQPTYIRIYPMHIWICARACLGTGVGTCCRKRENEREIEKRERERERKFRPYFGDAYKGVVRRLRVWLANCRYGRFH